ncbi:MAG: hypothetical protein ACK56I_29505, partial [bacterium]
AGRCRRRSAADSVRSVDIRHGPFGELSRKSLKTSRPRILSGDRTAVGSISSGFRRGMCIDASPLWLAQESGIRSHAVLRSSGGSADGSRFRAVRPAGC